MVDARVQTKPSLPATVVGLEQEILIGERVRKSFGSRTFWGSIVGCYWIVGGLFYKVSFDDGDVDIFSSDEVLRDVAAARQHAQEKFQALPETTASVHKAAVDDYLMAMRHHHLKRKRDDVIDRTAFSTRRIRLWGQRLYASIYTNSQNETFIREMVTTDDGQMGEMEATGQVKVGDMIVAINQTRVLGMTSSDLAELIRNHKRPITLTFYRPQQMQLQEAQRGQVQDLTASSASMTTKPTQQVQQHITQAQCVPWAQHTATMPRQQAATSASCKMPLSPGVPRPVFAQPLLLVQNIADQRTQLSNRSQAHDLSAKEIVRQRLNQNVAARQASSMPGYPTGVFDRGNVIPVGGVPSTHGGMYQPHQIQILHSVSSADAVRLSSGFTTSAARRAMPIHRRPSEYNQEPNQRQHTGSLISTQMWQNKAVSGPSGHLSEQLRTSASAGASAGANKFCVVTQVEPEQRVISSQLEKAQQEASITSRYTFDQELRSNQDVAVSVPHGNHASTSCTTTIKTSTSTTRDAEAIARQAEKNPIAAERAMSSSTCTTSLLSLNNTASEDMEDATSLLSASAPAAKDQVATEREMAGVSNTMSFLSPNDFESSMLSHGNLSTRTTANNPLAEVKSNVSLVSVSVSRHRLYLTLGVQGTLIAVTSFIPDEFGQPGEVEASGKVFLGDVLMRINEIVISGELMPSHVADIVRAASRPMTLWFKRASWDILDGKA